MLNFSGTRIFQFCQAIKTVLSLFFPTTQSHMSALTGFIFQRVRQTAELNIKDTDENITLNSIECDKIL